ncbi:hypothetical protein MMP66_13225 [Acinetobacter dispersus]|uniref:hypothetical protein n=1 Tax=Acinetobacter dispersus TaxID=70348 RepID=UPI001F4ACC50|nr:hypothetical protein [Acinetobacter dispersus]MCH7395223.1 hypothetical protein [Acinetobacter dispersus]
MNIKIIALWIFGFLFIFAGFGAFSSSFIGGALYILGGLSLLPPVQRKVSSLIGKTIAIKWFVIFTLILMLIAPTVIKSSEQKALQNGTASKDLIEREARKAKQKEQEIEQEKVRSAEAAKKENERSEFSRKVEIQTDSRIALMNFLKDPDSADIRNHNGNCGEVNSKNGFGGYTGYKRFIASSAIVAIEGENMDSDEFQKAWSKICN